MYACVLCCFMCIRCWSSMLHFIFFCIYIRNVTHNAVYLLIVCSGLAQDFIISSMCISLSHQCVIHHVRKRTTTPAPVRDVPIVCGTSLPQRWEWHCWVSYEKGDTRRTYYSIYSHRLRFKPGPCTVGMSDNHTYTHTLTVHTHIDTDSSWVWSLFR